MPLIKVYFFFLKNKIKKIKVKLIYPSCILPMELFI